MTKKVSALFLRGGNQKGHGARQKEVNEKIFPERIWACSRARHPGKWSGKGECMRKDRARKRAGAAGLALLLLLGCSPVPEPVRIAAESQGSFASIRTHPEAYRGQPALLGGRVLRVVILDGRTRIEIDRLPLDDDDRPRGDAKGQGPFLAEIREKVAPSTYPWGRVVTVWGKFAGAAGGRPLVAAEEVYLWPRRYGKEPLYPPAPYQEGNVGAGWDPGWWW